MPLNARSIGVSIAVICFFGLSFVSWLSGLSPFTCCRRAVAGAAIAYIAVSIAVRAINNVLTNAMIASKINQQKDKGRDSKDAKYS